ncbi:MAG: penicillin-binding protein 2 [Propionibacteriaceae bacterium]|jgi:peptidoglycan glycosyltransferase|nr:penicillin-binding protein 2 [Propionibacteriaceae bacterium]
MNRQIRLVSLVAALMVFALLGNLTYFTVARQQDLEAQPENVRTVYSEFDRQRGQILAGDTVIAETVPAAATDERFDRQRVYPQGSLYAHITGYYSFVYGTRGIENSYDAYLAGTDPTQAMKSLVQEWNGETPAGATVQTTIDPKLQQVATEQLGQAEGAIVVLDPATGAVKAMVSTPSYDPNLLATHDFDALAASWAELIADPTKAMVNRAARDVFPPGSTAKLITAAAALKAGYTPDTLIDTPSSIQLPNSDKWLPNASACGNGQQTFAFALAMSCNTSFANLGRALGADALQQQAELFGFNSTHFDDLGDAPSRYFTRVDDSGNLVAVHPDDAQVMMSAMGQWEIAASPLQMAMVAATIVNGGLRMDPYVVEKATAADGTVLYEHEATSVQAMSEADAKTLMTMMQGVVEWGTGTAAQIPGVTMGGKTGTAEWEEGEQPYAWYVGYATDPNVVVCVFIQSASVEATDMASGALAGPILRNVIQATRPA